MKTVFPFYCNAIFVGWIYLCFFQNLEMKKIHSKVARESIYYRVTENNVKYSHTILLTSSHLSWIGDVNFWTDAPWPLSISLLFVVLVVVINLFLLNRKNLLYWILFCVKKFFWSCAIFSYSSMSYLLPNNNVQIELYFLGALRI